jgi:sugar phosphate isomerase/epimerase
MTLSIDFLTALGLHPVEFVHVAADLGCPHISLGVAPLVKLPAYAPWSLIEDAPLRRAVGEALRERGVAVAGGEGFFHMPGRDLAALAPAMDALAELGAPMIGMVTFDKDRASAFDACGRFAELAAARGMRSVVEFVPGLGIPDLATAVAAAAHVGRSDFGVAIDAMHLFRSGSTAADVAALDPALIGRAQLCDAPLVPVIADYGTEAAQERLVPGEGELPLRELVEALPADLSIGLEVPMYSKAEAGTEPRDLIRPIVDSARRILAEAGRG